jgi:hypothetical protein
MIASGITLALPRFIGQGAGTYALAIGGMFFGFGVFGLLSNFERR